MVRRKIERGLAITVIATTITACIIATVISTVVTFYPEVISDIKNLF